jgi:hypothetical protein
MRSEIATNEDGTFIIFPNDYISQHVKYNKPWEPHFKLIIKHLIEPGSTVLDGGANLGYNSVLLGKQIGPTGTLTITGNVLSNEFNSITPSLENISDYYFPKEFRPYIFKLLPEFPGSNYWFGPGVPVTDLIDEIEPIRQIGSESNDAILRSIFNRAIKAINEQKQFEIYPFYHIKLKGIRT